MLYFDFKNYEEFNERFGMRTTHSGGSSRNNGILLAFLKGEFKQKKSVRALTLDEMYSIIEERLSDYSLERGGNMCLNGNLYHSSDYVTDVYKGVCEDGDIRSIRYVRKDNDRVYKMKAGKMMRHIIMSCPSTSDMAEQAIIWFCETFAEKWKAYTQSLVPDYNLVVDDDFKSIYTRKCLKGEFNSCMNNKGYEGFYNNCVKAKAASLRDQNGLIVARCVIFTEVKTFQDDKVYRLAERQYSTNQDNSLKQLLVDKLIEAGEIDGYKRVGAGCHDPQAFVLNDGRTFDYELYIKAFRVKDGLVPYMDSFKYYNESSCLLYNDNDDDIDWVLESTCGYMQRPEDYEDDLEWDEWHEEYCEQVTTVHYYTGTRWSTMDCNIDRLEDFVEIDDEYYEEEHVYWSEYEGSNIIEGQQCYSKYMHDYLRVCNALFHEDAGDWFPRYNDLYYKEWLAEQEELVEAI